MRSKSARPVKALLRLIQPGARFIQFLDSEEAFILCEKKGVQVSAATIEALFQLQWIDNHQIVNGAVVAEMFPTPLARQMAQEIIAYRNSFSQLALWSEEDEDEEEEAIQTTMF